MDCNPIEMGCRIAFVRKKSGYSQLDIADAVYVSSSYISKIESGIREPSFEFMVRMAEITETSLDYLIAGKKEARDVKRILKDAIAALSELEREL